MSVVFGRSRLRRPVPSDATQRGGYERVPGVGAAVARFMLGTLLAVAVVVVGGFFALRAVTIHEAERDTRQQVQTEGALVEAAGLRDGVLRGKQAALDHLDTVVQSDVLNKASIVRVKVWSTDGTILYSDEPKLIGRHYGLGEEERALLRNGGAEAEVSNLDLPENQFERQEASSWRPTRRSARRTARRSCSRSTSASARSARAPSACWPPWPRR